MTFEDKIIVDKMREYTRKQIEIGEEAEDKILKEAIEKLKKAKAEENGD